jgi:adenylylsulfate kinase
MAGLPGTGKSSIARALAAQMGGAVLDKDPIRAALFPPAEIEYSATQDDFCVAIMLQVADYLFRKDADKIVILDGRPFAKRYQRAELGRFSEAHGIPLRIIECVCSEQTARARLERDVAAATHLAGNRDVALYQAVKAGFEPIEEPRLVVNTDQDLATCVALCLAYLHDQTGVTPVTAKVPHDE